MQTDPKKLSLSAILLIVVSSLVCADELDDWFAANRRASRYEEIRNDLALILSELKREGIPASIFINKLDEGLGKRIDPSRLLRGAQAEALRLETAHALFDESGLEPSEESYRRISIYLNGGVTGETILAIHEGTGLDGKRTYGVCDAMVEIVSIYDLTPETAAGLGGVIAQSSLSMSEIQSLPAMFLKARIGQIPGPEMATIVTRQLERGNGVLGIGREIQQKGNRQ